MRIHTLVKTLLFASGFVLVSSVYAETGSSRAPKTARKSPDGAVVQKAGSGGLAEVAKRAAAARKAAGTRQHGRRA